MISCLHIQNIATIENLFMEFDQGLTVLTGETGAGKSLMIESISILLGQKVQSRIVREGAKTADIQGIFDLSGKSKALQWLEEEGLDSEDPTQILIRRQVTESKRSRCWISGHLVPLAKVREFSQFVAQVNHQHDQVNLQQSSVQMLLYDAYCQSTELVEGVSVKAQEINRLQKTIAAIQKNSHEREQRIDYLNFQLHEFQSINLDEFANESLFDESQMLKSVQEIQSMSQEALECINSSQEIETGLSDLTQILNEKIQNLLEIDSSWSQADVIATTISESISDLERLIQSKVQSLEEDPEKLEIIEEQIAQFRKLERKYGKGYETIIDAKAKIQGELDEIDSSSSSITELEKQKSAAICEYEKIAASLSVVRRKKAKEFSKRIRETLHSLEMPKARFEIGFKDSTLPYSKNGNETIEFQFSANGNKKLSPISDTASGGELSRLSLALSLLDEREEKPGILIFDEIDSGISGETLIPFGKVMKQLGQTAQIICISHSATIAAYADHHVFMSKSVGKNSKVLQSKAQKLDRKERREEIARLLDGRKTKQSLSLASSMLQGIPY